MISFCYLKLTFVISMAFICYAVHVSHMLFCVGVLITQNFKIVRLQK